MGCVNSKKPRSEARAINDASSVGGRSKKTPEQTQKDFRPVESIKGESRRETEVNREHESNKKRCDLEDPIVNLKLIERVASQKRAAFGIDFGRLIEAEHVVAGWPSWLAAVAGEAIEGWLPLRSDSYERLEKIGQGTYSSVYRAREVKTSKMVAVKKVRFDTFQPESVSFMAREILILRRLDHPNIVKLEGIITSRLSCSIYFVFEYMEHDLAGLLSCPDIKFTESQIKCYMRQLLSGLEHCHSNGVMHRDIKTSNILLNNEGCLKIADFGLANFIRPKNKQPLTSRVVTLWYRPPELLLGSTTYGESVDLWSVGCVFAELFIGRPILKGRNEVEQLHKIFKLCGSPPDEYWRRSKLPLATMFKPHQPYESTLRERCKELPKSVVNLIETFLYIEPYKRCTATSALNSQYFDTPPYACDPSNLPKYPPNKEMDAKIREETSSISRKKISTTARLETSTRNPRRLRKSLAEPSDFNMVPTEDLEAKVQLVRRTHGTGINLHRRRKSGIEFKKSSKKSFDAMSDVSQTSQMTQESQATSIQSLPMQVAASTSFAWAKKQKQAPDVFTRLHNQPTASRSQKSIALDVSTIWNSHETLDNSEGQENEDPSVRVEGFETSKRLRHRIRAPDSFDASDIYGQHESSEGYATRRKSRARLLSGTITISAQEIA